MIVNAKKYSMPCDDDVTELLPLIGSLHPYIGSEELELVAEVQAERMLASE